MTIEQRTALIPAARTATPPGRALNLRWVLGTAAMWIPTLLVAIFIWAAPLGSDSHAYWLTGQHSRLYGAAPGTKDAFLYSPAFADVIRPLTLLPWHAFMVAWMLAAAAAFVWLLAPLGFRYGAPLFCWCLVEVVIGNIYAFLAVAAVIGLRHGGVWALALLTKITPGVGLVWFVVRREWRSLGMAVGVTLGIALASYVVSPQAWTDWVHFLLSHRGAHGSMAWPVRVALGYGLAAIAARRGSAWLLAPAMLLAQPMMVHWFVALPILAAIPRLRMAQLTDGNRPAGAVGRGLSRSAPTLSS